MEVLTMTGTSRFALAALVALSVPTFAVAKPGGGHGGHGGGGGGGHGGGPAMHIGGGGHGGGPAMRGGGVHFRGRRGGPAVPGMHFGGHRGGPRFGIAGGGPRGHAGPSFKVPRGHAGRA